MEVIGAAGDGEGGRGRLVAEPVGGATALREARATSPLKLLTPNNHGHGAWVYVATFGGGLVDGDRIDLDVTVSPGATVLLGTQASTKVYRCPTRGCRQDLRARVGHGGLLALVPDPVVCFAEARYAQSIRVDLAAGASLILIDAVTSGRSARGERWDFHRYTSRTTVEREGTPLLLEPIVLDPAHGPLRARLGRFEILATIALFGPQTAGLREAALRPAGRPERTAPLLEAVSPIGDDGVLVRLAGTSVEEVTRAARRRLADLGALLGDDPFARKW